MRFLLLWSLAVSFRKTALNSDFIWIFYDFIHAGAGADNSNAMLENNFLRGSNYLLPGIKVVAKLKYLVANTGGPVIGHCQVYDQTKFHMVKGIDYAFDHTKLCLTYK